MIGLIAIALHEWVSVHRYRIEIVAERDGARFSGASEYTIIRWHGPDDRAYRAQVFGEAVVIQASRDTLFALVNGAGLAAFSVAQISDYIDSRYATAEIAPNRFSLSRGLLPAIVRFRDLSDSETAEPVLAPHLWVDMSVTNDYLVRATIERLPRALFDSWSGPRQVRALLPWLPHGSVNLLGQSTLARMPPLAGALRATSFVSNGE